MWDLLINLLLKSAQRNAWNLFFSCSLRKHSWKWNDRNKSANASWTDVNYIKSGRLKVNPIRTNVIVWICAHFLQRCHELCVCLSSVRYISLPAAAFFFLPFPGKLSQDIHLYHSGLLSLSDTYCFCNTWRYNPLAAILSTINHTSSTLWGFVLDRSYWP